jgi:hypothetical protein
MKEDYTHISVILDRTGSMQSIRDDTIGGFNAFLKEQQSQPGVATLTLVQFDTQDPYEVIHRFKPISEVPELTHNTYVPRASTPLLDAIGRGINDLEKCLADMEESQKPAKVVLAIITDGQENSSREFRKDQIVKMIQQKQEENRWQLVFLSADMASIDDAGEYGIRAASSMSHDRSAAGVASAWRSMSGSLSGYRRSKHHQDMEFTEDDRAKQQSERERKEKDQQ